LKDGNIENDDPIYRERPATAITINSKKTTPTGERGLGETSEEQRNVKRMKAPNNPELVKQYKTRVWTLTHSYYANMGGLLCPDYFVSQNDRDTSYNALTGSKLSTKYGWCDPHPLKELVLSKEEIEDKSKADWLLKSIAVS
jgi:hypothetical protein